MLLRLAAFVVLSLSGGALAGHWLNLSEGPSLKACQPGRACPEPRQEAPAAVTPKDLREWRLAAPSCGFLPHLTRVLPPVALLALEPDLLPARPALAARRAAPRAPPARA